MVSAAAFNAVLEREGLPPAYRFDAAVLEAQLSLDGGPGMVDAFGLGLKALFHTSDSTKGRDDLTSMVMTEPEAFGLTAVASSEQINAVILKALKEDPDLGFFLLPEGAEPVAAGEVTLFPPEEGESVRDFWIWVVRCPSFFPGPLWLLVNRADGSRAYHYGRL